MSTVAPYLASRTERLDHDLLRRYHDDRDLAARDRVIERCMPLVRSIAWTHRDDGEEIDDLIQAGAIGLVKAVDRFDPDAGHRFVSYAAPTIAGEIKRHLRDHTWAVHVPRSAQELSSRVRSTRLFLLDRNGREPTTAELALQLRVPPASIVDARSAGAAYRSLSLDRIVDDGHAAEPASDEDPGYQDVEDREFLDWATRGIDRRSRRMVVGRYVEDRLQREIAADHDVSPMLVSRILEKARNEIAPRLRPAPPAASPI